MNYAFLLDLDNSRPANKLPMFSTLSVFILPYQPATIFYIFEWCVNDVINFIKYVLYYKIDVLLITKK